MLIGVIISEKFCFSKCLHVCLAWNTISCQTDKGNRVKQSQFLQGTCVEDAGKTSNNSIGFFKISGRQVIRTLAFFKYLDDK